MPIRDLCQTHVATIDRATTVNEAARLMRERHVGDVVVCERSEGKLIPVGILTDRDIVVGIVAMDIPTDNIRVEDVMTPTLVTVDGEKGVFETIQLMEKYGVRRLPVVDEQGSLVGIVSSVDLLELLSEEIASISRLSERQKIREREIRL
ncbi:MAG: CBS domain-containing protein [Bdellovibrionaceae bacterium]|nr:CBS domain-containing protein [Pseudobdellovibrionaceae bacterium]